MRTLLAGLGLVLTLASHAQEQCAELGYAYLWAPAWDRMVRTYNFARPFLDAQQPLLQHGIGAGYARTFRGQRRLRSGIALHYGRFISHAEATGLESRLRLHQLHVAYAARLVPQQAESRWGLGAGIGIAALHLSRTVNGATIDDEDRRPRALGLGPELHLTADRRFAWGDGRWIAPFATLRIAPWVYAPDAEAIINQTIGLVAGDGAFMLRADAGLRVVWGAVHGAGPADEGKAR